MKNRGAGRLHQPAEARFLEDGLWRTAQEEDDGLSGPHQTGGVVVCGHAASKDDNLFSGKVDGALNGGVNGNGLIGRSQLRTEWPPLVPGCYEDSICAVPPQAVRGSHVNQDVPPVWLEANAAGGGPDIEAVVGDDPGVVVEHVLARQPVGVAAVERQTAHLVVLGGGGEHEALHVGRYARQGGGAGLDTDRWNAFEGCLDEARNSSWSTADDDKGCLAEGVGAERGIHRGRADGCWEVEITSGIGHRAANCRKGPGYSSLCPESWRPEAASWSYPCGRRSARVPKDAERDPVGDPEQTAGRGGPPQDSPMIRGPGSRRRRSTCQGT